MSVSPNNITITPLNPHVAAIIDAPDSQTIKKEVNNLMKSFGLISEEEETLKTIQSLFKNEAKESLEVLSQKLNKEIQKYLEIDGINSGYLLENSVNSRDKDAVKSIRESLIQEHNVTTSTEKMIIDIAIAAYLKSLRCSHIYSLMLQEDDGSYSFNDHKINHMRYIEKQINSANQQFFTAITFLKELRQPRVNIKVQSKQTFVAQNQQFNDNA